MFSRAISTAALVAALVVGPTAASANLFLYKHANYEGLMGYRSSMGWWNMSAAANDELSSVKNATRFNSAFWYHANRQGHCFQIGPYTNDPSFWWHDNDEVTSYGLGYGC